MWNLELDAATSEHLWIFVNGFVAAFVFSATLIIL